MAINNGGGHARKSFRHSIQIGLVADASVHHLIVTFEPRNAFVVSACRIRIENKTAWRMTRLISPADGLIF